MTRSRRSLTLAAAVVIVVSLVVLAVARRDASHREPQRHLSSSPTSALAADAPNATGVTNKAEPANELGARRAALRFLELTEQVASMTPDDGADAQRAVSTARSAERLAADVRSKLAFVEAEVPEGVTVHVAPVAVRSTPEGDGWRVSIWYVGVAIIGHEIAVEQWVTATYSVVWEGGGWRMDDLVSTPGPQPSRMPTSMVTPIGQLIRALEGFTDEGITP